jgi:hypothetical protein
MWMSSAINGIRFRDDSGGAPGKNRACAINALGRRQM